MSAIEVPITTRSTPAAPERTHVDFPLDCATAVGGGVWTLWPFLATAGVPAYQHDWSWPLTQLRAQDALRTLGSTWLPEGLGHANPFANASPVAFGIDGVSALMPPALALRVYLLLVVIVAGCGVARLCRHTGANSFATRIAMAFYLVAPPLFNKISAGHIAFWAAYALLPWMAYFAWRAFSERRADLAAAATIACGLSCLQPQFYVFCGVLIAIVALFHLRSRASLFLGAAVALGIALVNSPALFALISLQSGFAATVPPPAMQNEELQSAGLLDAFRLMGYIIPYARTAYAALPFGNVAFPCFTAVCAIAALGVITSKKSFVFAIGALGAVGFVVMTGLKGPASLLWSWAFTHVGASALFREFYHAAPLLALAYAVGLAQAATRIPRAAPIVAALLAAGTLPLAASGHARDLHFITLSPDALKASQAIMSAPAGRLVPLPYKMPLEYGISNVSGVDALAYTDASHPSAAEYGVTPLLDLAAGWYLDGDVASASAMIRRLGVSTIASRAMLSSAFPDNLVIGNERMYRRRALDVFGKRSLMRLALFDAPACYGAYCVAPFTGLPIIGSADRVIATPLRWNEVPANATPVDSGRFVQIHFKSAAVALTPHGGWVQAAGWLWLKRPWNQLMDPIAVTDVPGEIKFTVAAPATLAYASPAKLSVCYAGGCRTYPAAPMPALLRVSAGEITIISSGPAGFGYAANGIAGTIEGAKLSDVAFASPWRASARVTGNGNALIVFRTRFDPNWILSGAVATHVRADGYANAWIVNLHGIQKVTLMYQPQLVFSLLAIVSALCYIALVFGALYAIRLRFS